MSQRTHGSPVTYRSQLRRKRSQNGLADCNSEILERKTEGLQPKRDDGHRRAAITPSNLNRTKRAPLWQPSASPELFEPPLLWRRKIILLQGKRIETTT